MIDSGKYDKIIESINFNRIKACIIPNYVLDN